MRSMPKTCASPSEGARGNCLVAPGWIRVPRWRMRCKKPFEETWIKLVRRQHGKQWGELDVRFGIEPTRVHRQATLGEPITNRATEPLGFLIAERTAEGIAETVRAEAEFSAAKSALSAAVASRRSKDGKR